MKAKIHAFRKFLILAMSVFLLMCAAGLWIGCAEEKAEGGYTVTFMTDGGTVYQPVQTQSAEQAVELPVPEKFGYRFIGWYLSADFSGEPIEGEEFVPVSDTTLYAKWEQLVYTVTFDSTSGTQYEPVTFDGKPIALPIPERDEYRFVGWFETADYSGEACGERYVPTKDIILYAKWEAEFFAVALETDGGTEHETLKDFGEGVTLPLPQKYGYEFEGWYASSDFSGEKVQGETYFAEADVTLYAKWKQVTYLYLYYGESTDHERLSYAPGTTVVLSELDTPQDLIIDGVHCPFVKWVYDGLEETDAPAQITLGQEHVYLVAVYDMSALPPKENIRENEDGSWTTTGKAIKVFMDEGENIGGYSLDATFRKGKSGSVNIAFRMIHSGADYAYEDAGTYYIAVGVIPSSGGLQISKVVNGAWSTIRGNMGLTSLPEAWQDKYNAAAVSDKITVNLMILDHGDTFDFYIDGDLAYTCADTALLDTFTGTGMGMRCSTTDTTFANYQYAPFRTVHFDAQGGTECADIEYALGRLDAPSPTLSEYVFTGWYYDAACNNAVDLNAPEIPADGATLYAGWREAKYTVTLIKDGKQYGQIGYETGSILLPVLTAEENKIFTGWYYDEACKNLVDASAPEIEGNVSLYAGWRLPVHSNLTDNGDGTYTVGNGSAAAVTGITEYEYTEIEASFSFLKGASGGGGLAFRMALYADNSYEKGAYYISVGIVPGTGRLQIGDIRDGFDHMTGSLPAFDKMPAAWQEKFNNAATNESIEIVLTVRDYGTYFEVYIDGDLAYTSSDDLSEFTGTGYGIRSSVKNITLAVTAKEIPSFTVSFETGEGSAIEPMKYIEGAAFELPIPVRNGYIFGGWYYDSELKNAVEDEFAPKADVTLYAAWEIAPYKVTLVSNCENEYDPIFYKDGAISLPTPTTSAANKIFDGWYYDAECSLPVDVSAPEISADLTLYAGWRLPVHSSLTDNGDGSYTVGNSNAAAVTGITEYKYTEIEASFSFLKGASGGGGLAFRMAMNADNLYEKNAYYLSAGIVPGTGRLQVAKISNGFAHMTGSIVAFDKMPAAWQEKFNAAEANESIPIILSVRDYGTYFEVYIDGDLAYTSTDDLSGFTGTGYGIRSSIKNITISLTVTEIGENTAAVKEEQA